jgi:hypothetical protein
VSRSAVVAVLIRGCLGGGQGERVALGVPAYGPPIAGVDDGAAALADPVKRCGQVGDAEIGEGSGVTGTRSTLMDPEAQIVGVGLPPRSGCRGPRREGDPQDPMPKPQGAIGIVRRELDEWCGHERKYGQWSALASPFMSPASRIVATHTADRRPWERTVARRTGARYRCRQGSASWVKLKPPAARDGHRRRLLAAAWSSARRSAPLDREASTVPDRFRPRPGVGLVGPSRVSSPPARRWRAVEARARGGCCEL